jgi:gamma-glutamyltranspeptidase/glutathione hydrolase
MSLVRPTRRGPGRPTLWGTFGGVASSDWFSAAAGMAMLEAGGNAFDAAVAAGFVLQVVEPHLCGPGGEMVAIFVSARDGRPTVVCGQGPAPQGATPAHFTGLGFDMVPGAGLLPAAVPGAFDAWMLLLRDYGTRTLRDVLDAAIGYAEGGFPLVGPASRVIRRVESVFREHWPTSAALYLRAGSVPKPLTMHRNPSLARTYRRLLAEAEAASGDREEQIETARRLWYRGFVAEAIGQFARRPHFDTSPEPHAGVITADDLASYQASYEDPATLEWRGWTVCKPGPWSQGPVLIQQLALLEDFESAEEQCSAEDIHLFAETAKLAYADRDAYYGDIPDVPLGTLLSSGYTRQRRGLIGPTSSHEQRPGRPGDREPRLPGFAKPVKEPVLPHGDTCHIDVVDRFGNLIAATPSGAFFTTSPVIDSIGFPLGTRLEMTWLEEGLPNTLRPGRRPRTTITPTLALRDGTPAVAFGSPGADYQEQWSLSFFLAYSAGLHPQHAIDRPRWHTRHLIDSFSPHEVMRGQLAVEPRVGEEVIAELRRRGHKVDVVELPATVGLVSAAGRDPATGLLFAAADGRRAHSYACGR